MGKEQLLKYCGSLEQVAGVRPVVYDDGRAGGMRAILVKNGPMEFSLTQDKCLDMAALTYKGISMGVLTKPGLQGRGHYDTNGEEALRSLMCGAMFTCGFENIHVARTVDGVDYPLHGRMRTTPMEKICMDAFFQGDDYILQVSGEGREACLFGENLVLRRTIRSVYGQTAITIRDEIENRAFRPEPMCLLYHVNAGYPFLQKGCRVLIPHSVCEPRNECAAQHMGRQFVMDEPTPNEPERVFLYTPLADSEGNTFCAVVNDELELALCIRWNVKQIPYLTQWKSMAAGDYALGLEPANAGFGGREDPRVQILQPQQLHINEWRIEIVEGKTAISALEREYGELSSSHV